MKYKPGSFSKNFAWHGEGLRKLYSAIRAGYRERLEPATREQWRADAEIQERALELIPINFFLHNVRGRLSIDELVYQAIRRDHSLKFDRLALFALNLSQVGKPPDSLSSRPTKWANEFVRERLGVNGTWSAAALDETAMTEFIAARLDATAGVVIKCRSNYRYLYEMCRYLPARLAAVNSGADQWAGSALFLAWDRFVLDGGASRKPALAQYARMEELHKLLGMQLDEFSVLVDASAGDYVAADGIDRFTQSAKTAAAPVEIPEEARGEFWIDQAESDAAVERRNVTAQAQVRDRKKAAALKKHYQNRCTFCALRLQIGDGEFYSEAAHIKPLGRPHNGSDKAANLIILCPNHHLQFDRGMMVLRKTGEEYVIESKIIGDKLHGRAITLSHKIDDECVMWHREWFASIKR